MSLLPVVYRAAVPVVEAAISRGPAVLNGVATRLGVKNTYESVMAAVKSSPLMTGLALFQIGEIGTDVYQMLVDNHPEVTEALTALMTKIDPIADDLVANLSQSAQELDLLDDAARMVGGLANFVKLRQALSMDQRYIELALQIRSMGYR